jgi:hypothetical protein
MTERTLAQFDSYDDMLELFTQYGMLSLFAPVFPLAPLLAYLNNLQEARADAMKICALQRPIPDKVSGLGAWNNAFEVMGYASVLVQAGLIGVATAQADWPAGLSPVARIVLVLLLEHAVLALKFVVEAQMSDVPQSVTMRVMREQMLRPQIVWAALRSAHDQGQGSARLQEAGPRRASRAAGASGSRRTSGATPAAVASETTFSDAHLLSANQSGHDRGEGLCARPTGMSTAGLQTAERPLSAHLQACMLLSPQKWTPLPCFMHRASWPACTHC